MMSFVYANVILKDNLGNSWWTYSSLSIVYLL